MYATHATHATHTTHATLPPQYVQTLTPLAQCDSHPARAASVAAGAGQGKAKGGVSRSAATAHASEVGQGPGGATPADAAEQVRNTQTFSAEGGLCSSYVVPLPARVYTLTVGHPPRSYLLLATHAPSS